MTNAMANRGVIGAENNLLEMGRVEWRVDQHRNLPSIREWGIIYPDSRDNRAMLSALCREAAVPEPMIMPTDIDQLVNLLEYVRGPLMLIGPGALALWRGDLVQAKCAWSMDGKCGVWWDQRAVLTCRTLEPPKSVPPFQTLARLLKGEVTVGDSVSNRCVHCGNQYSHFDRDAVPYCEAHWPKEMGRWEVARDAKSRQIRDDQPF